MTDPVNNTILTSLHGRRFGLTKDNAVIVDGARVFNGTLADLWKGAPSQDADPALAHVFFDDFFSVDQHTYTSNDDTVTGTNAFADAAGGVLNVVTAAADNDYHAMSTVAENWLFAADKPLWFEARFRCAEANTNQSTWWMGLTDTLTTGGMQANAAGPLASYDGALIFKTPETALTVNFETSNAGTQNTLSAFATAITNTWHRAGFYFDGDPSGSGTGTITPWFHTGSAWVKGTAQNITLSGLAEMHAVFGIKAGPSGGAETLQMDYIKIVQVR